MCIELFEVIDFVMFKLFRESFKDCREDEEDVLFEDFDGGRVGLVVLLVFVFNRLFLVFRILILFCCEDE